jgi:hypothetical protein
MKIEIENSINSSTTLKKKDASEINPMKIVKK